jgi:hypothetical protein
VVLKGAIPTPTEIQAVKNMIFDGITAKLDAVPMLVFYGELMCNPSKYGYDDGKIFLLWSSP